MVSTVCLDMDPLELVIAKKQNKTKTKNYKMICVLGKTVWMILLKNYPSKYLLNEMKTSVQNILFNNYNNIIF